jgi:uncharacterized protein YfaQ (DUF2300 family)
MKKLCLITCAILFCASLAFGDEVEDKLSPMATEELKANTREMIRSGINSDDAIQMTKLMLQNRFNHQLILRAQHTIMNAHREGLPVGPIMNKAHEGMAKRVQHGNLVQAMERVRSRYTFAYQQAKTITQNRAQMHHMGNTIAQGLAAGMNQEDVGRIMQRFQHMTREMTRADAEELARETFMATRTMARLGVSSKAATDLVCQALQNRYTAREMKTMRNSFMTRSRNENPTNLAKSYANEIQGGKGSGSPGSPGMGQSGPSGDHGGSGGKGGSGGGHK